MFYLTVDDPDCLDVTCERCGLEWVPGDSGPGLALVLRWHAIEFHGVARCEHIVEGGDAPSASDHRRNPHRVAETGQCQRQLGHPGSCMTWQGDAWRTAAMRPEQKRRNARRTG